MRYVKANANAYSGKRSRKDVKFIVIHYTGNRGDTAINNANYFKLVNQRKAGAHFFVGSKGKFVKSVALNRLANSVGVKYTHNPTYWGKCTNANSVSIELCDAVDGYTVGHVKGTKKVINYIRKYCPNAKVIITHYDVCGKECPPWHDNKFKSFLKELEV